MDALQNKSALLCTTKIIDTDTINAIIMDAASGRLTFTGEEKKFPRNILLT